MSRVIVAGLLLSDGRGKLGIQVGISAKNCPPRSSNADHNGMWRDKMWNISESYPPGVFVFDNFLSPPFEQSEIDRIASLRTKDSGNNYLWTPIPKIHGFSPEVARLFGRKADLLKLPTDEIGGVECWANHFTEGDEIPMHSDVDEMLFRRQRRIATGEVGVVYFGNSENLAGGSLIFEDGVVVLPKANRCVIFFAATRHAVEKVRAGKRSTVVMSIWATTPLAYRTASSTM